MKLINLPEIAHLAPLTHGFFDDFQGFLTAQSGWAWTVVTAVDGTVLNTDAAGGIVAIVNGTASIGDNEDAYLAREPEAFLPAASKPIVFEALIQATQVSTNTINVVAGLTDGVAANLMVNDGAGPKTSGTSMLFYSKDGSLNLFAHVSLSTTQQSVELTAANSLNKKANVIGTSAYQRLRIEFQPKSSTSGDVEFYIDGVLVYKFVDWVFTSATEMQAVIGIKGGTAAAATVNVDYCFCYQKR